MNMLRDIMATTRDFLAICLFAALVLFIALLWIGMDNGIVILDANGNALGQQPTEQAVKP